MSDVIIDAVNGDKNSITFAVKLGEFPWRKVTVTGFESIDEGKLFVRNVLKIPELDFSRMRKWLNENPD